MSVSRSIRNVGIIAHIDAGKTTLAERFLYYTHKIHHMGEVDDGSTTMDYLPEEQERGITIVSASSSCLWKDTVINLIDTPGHVDFTIEVERTLRVLDGAVCVICATRGVEPQSETVWKQAEKFFIPKIVFVNKMDRPGADFAEAVKSLELRLGARTLPVQMPFFDEKGIFKSIVDLITLEELFFNSADGGATVTRVPVQGETLEKGLVQREKMLEVLADTDDEFMGLYLAEKADKITKEQISMAIARATKSLKLAPVLLGSALHNTGVQPVLDAAIAWLPSSLEAHLPKAWLKNNPHEHISLKSDPKGSFVALIFKVLLYETHVLSLMRIYSGTLLKGDLCYNASLNKEEKAAQIYLLHADDKEAISAAYAGDVVAVSGFRHARTGHTLSSKNSPVLLEDIASYSPVISIALEPENSEEGKKLNEALDRYLLEDPTLALTHDEYTGQRIVSGMGELHLEVLLEKLKREYKISPRHGRPRVVYKETIKAAAENAVDIEQEFAGSLNSGSVELVVAPLARGEGNSIEIEDEAEHFTEGENDAKNNSALHKHGAYEAKRELQNRVVQTMESALQSGPLGGHVVADVSVKIKKIENRHGLGAVVAGQQALREALQLAGPVLLKPVMALEIFVPTEHLGDILNLVTARNGKVLELVSKAQGEDIKAEAPLDELFDFATFLRSASKGRALLSMKLDRFDIC